MKYSYFNKAQRLEKKFEVFSVKEAKRSDYPIVTKSILFEATTLLQKLTADEGKDSGLIIQGLEVSHHVPLDQD